MHERAGTPEVTVALNVPRPATLQAFAYRHTAPWRLVAHFRRADWSGFHVSLASSLCFHIHHHPSNGVPVYSEHIRQLRDILATVVNQSEGRMILV